MTMASWPRALSSSARLWTCSGIPPSCGKWSSVTRAIRMGIHGGLLVTGTGDGRLEPPQGREHGGGPLFLDEMTGPRRGVDGEHGKGSGQQSDLVIANGAVVRGATHDQPDRYPDLVQPG